MRRSWASASAGLFLFAGSGVAMAACDTKNASFQDTFEILDPSWGEGTDLKVENGQILVAPGAQYYRWVPSSAGIYEDVDVCVTAKTVAAVNPLKTMAGIVFWYQDNQKSLCLRVCRQRQCRGLSPAARQVDCAGRLAAGTWPEAGRRCRERAARGDGRQSGNLLRQRPAVQADQWIASGQRAASRTVCRVFR